MKENDTHSKEDDFASLYEQSLSEMPVAFRRGQMVETTVLSISKDTIFLQLNGKSEGILDREEVTDKDGQLTVKAGDPIKVFFMQAVDGELRFSVKITGDKAGPSMLEQAYHSKIPVEGLVEKEIKGGYDIRIGDSRAFCPYSQMGQRRAEDSAECIGKRLSFKILEYKENGRNILVSNRAIHEEAHQEKVKKLKESLKEGMVVTGVITSIQDFGAFVDLDGVQALLPISEIGRTRVEDIKAVLSVGQEIKAAILKIDWKSERISLSMKSLLADPWDHALETYPEGSRHSGTVVRVTDFGLFVSLEPGLDGLIHISELRTPGSYANKKELAAKLGKSMSVEVLGIDLANKRLSLKPASSMEEDQASAKYIDEPGDADTYNPFAALLKK